CQNNHWAISVPSSKQTASESIAIKAQAYGFGGVKVDGNDAVAVHAAVKQAVDKARSGGGPTLVECETYRIGAHSSSDDPTRYRDEREVEQWRKRDPLDLLRGRLQSWGIWSARAGRGARHAAPARTSARDHPRPRREGSEHPSPARRAGAAWLRDLGDRPRRRRDLSRAGTAGRLSRPRPQARPQGRAQVRRFGRG